MLRLKAAGVHQFGVRIHHAGDYPTKLRAARHPVEMLYYRGIWEISETRGVAVVGTARRPRTGSGVDSPCSRAGRSRLHRRLASPRA